jgi:hypothetical protein
VFCIKYRLNSSDKQEQELYILVTTKKKTIISPASFNCKKKLRQIKKHKLQPIKKISILETVGQKQTEKNPI